MIITCIKKPKPKKLPNKQATSKNPNEIKTGRATDVFPNSVLKNK